jgi:2-dehydropantoate 2-reductase
MTTTRTESVNARKQEQEKDPVVVIGMGAIGSTVAARIAEIGYPIIACACTRIDSITIIENEETTEFPVTWVASPENLPVSKWVLLATKLHHIPGVEPWLRAATDAGSLVVSLQNGVEHRELVSPYTNGTVVPALVYINVERLSPGVVKVRVTPKGHVLQDDVNGRRALNELLTGTRLSVELDEDFLTAAWLKMLTNLVANPITALTGRHVEVIREPLVSDFSCRVLDETVAVGRAAGATIPDNQTELTMDWLIHLPEGATTSTLQDRAAGRSLEYEGMTGVVVRLGRLHGIPTPANSGLLALLSAINPDA